MKDIIAIRVDSSKLIGSGHLMRCLTLAQRLRAKGKEVHFICRSLEGDLSSIVSEQGFTLHIMFSKASEGRPELQGYAKWLTVTQEVDASETSEILQGLPKVSCLIVDHYTLDYSWEKLIRPYTKEIFVIDDLANRKHDCDVLLDQNFYPDKDSRYDGLVPTHTKLLLGPKHALLRQEFYDYKKKLRPRDGVIRRILVFYGGSDNTSETEKAIQALISLNIPHINVDVVVGGSNPRSEEIQTLCDGYDFLHYHHQVDNMAELMARADLSLGAGGTTTWERCYLGLPTLVTAIADNQLRLCEDAGKAGYIKYLGKWDDVTSMKLAAAIKAANDNEVLTKMQQQCQIEVNFTDSHNSYLRAAAISDAELLYQWRNDEDARQSAFNTAELVYDEHCSWLKNTLADKEKALLFIMRAYGEDIGQIRLNKTDASDNEWLISYSIAKEHRAKGYGRQIIHLIENQILQQYAHIKLLAYVKKQNIASQRVFAALGYNRLDEIYFWRYEKVLSLKQ